MHTTDEAPAYVNNAKVMWKKLNINHITILTKTNYTGINIIISINL